MYWYDGELIKEDNIQLNITKPGLIYGATVFTTMRVYDRSLTHPLTNWSAHCDRLKRSLTVFNWQPLDWQRLQQLFCSRGVCHTPSHNFVCSKHLAI